MFFWKRKPKRLYIPVKAEWYKRPRNLKAARPRNAIVLKKRGLFGLLKEIAKKSVYAAMGALLIGSLLLILFLSSYFSIKTIGVARQTFNIDSAKIENKLNNFIGQNLVFFPKNRIVKVIHQEFPEFSEIHVKKIFPDRIQIDLVSQPLIANLRAFYILPLAEETQPENFTELNKAIEELSSTDPSILTNNANPLADQNQTKDIFDINQGEGGDEGATEQKGLLNRIGQVILDQEENLELMTFVVRGLTQPVEDREQAIPQKSMEYILEAIQYLGNSMGQEVQRVELMPIANELRLKIKDNIVLWLSIDRSYKEQLDKLKAVFEAAGLDLKNIAYIDLRIKEKVIYCLRNTRCDKTIDK